MSRRACFGSLSLLVFAFLLASPLDGQASPDRTRGALWGGGIGLVAGGLLGGLTVESDEGGDFGGSLVEGAATGEAVVLGALTGAVIGALLGATLFAPSKARRGGSDPGRALQLVPVMTPKGPVARFRLRWTL